MEIVIFFVFVAVCAFALVWASRKTKAETDLAHKRRAVRNKSRSEKLVAPRDSLLSHKEEVWATRRQHANSGVENTNKFAPKSSSDGNPEYDGYSRRDRHHVRQRTAQVKKESHAEDEAFTMTAIEFDQEPNAGPAKAAS